MLYHDQNQETDPNTQLGGQAQLQPPGASSRSHTISTTAQAQGQGESE